MDWAERHTYSSVWSCLAAHAALLYLDGIERRRLPEKRFGIFECVRVGDHPLTATIPERLRMPHSRWNDLPEDALVASGYRLLTRSLEAGADSFVKERQSLFVFFQGHPEYEADTLLLEYRRDIGRYLRYERETYPPLPHGYEDDELTDALQALRDRAMADRREELLASFPTALGVSRVTNTWRPAAVGVYRNWLRYLCQRKEQALMAT
jgi:homoserine O-succinyltransferase